MKTLRLASVLFAGLALAGAAHAQTNSGLQYYFDFTSYGTVSSGNTITSGALGLSSANATVQSAATALTASGLRVTDNASGTNNDGLVKVIPATGVTIGGSALTSLNSDFTLQEWYTTTTNLFRNADLFGGTAASTTNSGTIGNTQTLFVSYAQGTGSTASAPRPVFNNGSQYGGVISTTTATLGVATNATFDFVLTYVASTHTFTEFINGTNNGTTTAANFNGLSALTNGFGIGGVAEPIINDNLADVNVSAFSFYSGALSTSWNGTNQIAAIQSFGPTPTAVQLNSIGIAAVPEPATYVLFGLGALVLVVAYRRKVA